MKSIIASAASSSLESVMIKSPANPLPFGAGYLRYLTTMASMDEEEPARSGMQQPVRYLAAVEPMMDAGVARWETVGGTARTAGQASSLREAVISLRRKIQAS